MLVNNQKVSLGVCLCYLFLMRLIVAQQNQKADTAVTLSHELTLQSMSGCALVD